MQASKRTKGLRAPKKAKRKRSDAEERFEDEDGLITDDRDDARTDGAEDAEDPAAEETPAEKRLRMAKQYIEQLRAAAAVAGQDDEDVDGQLAEEAAEAHGRLNRRIAASLKIPAYQTVDGNYGSGTFVRGDKLSSTAVTLSSDDSKAYTTSKCGCVTIWDIENSSRKRLYRPGDSRSGVSESTADWVAPAARRGSSIALYAVAVSSDDRYLAAGGGDKMVHVWDLRSNEYLKGLRSHKELVSGLSFRMGGSELYSSSFDRSLKMWSVPDFNYMDSLFGHQSELTAVHALRQEKCVTAGFDRTCRVWRIPEESQLIFRASGLATDCVRYMSNTEWISGNYDGSVALWSQLKKKPISLHRGAHSVEDVKGGGTGPGSPSEEAAGWVQSVAVCPQSDLAASGAGDGLIRMWQVDDGDNGQRVLQSIGTLPARGFVNGLAIVKTGKLVLAAMGQEPRLGRWVRDKKAKNGLLLHRLVSE